MTGIVRYILRQLAVGMVLVRVVQLALGG